MKEEPDELITVVVPARNEEAFIESCLDSVAGQDARNLQIIVVDGDSTDGTAEVVRRYAERDPRVELLHNPHRIVPSSLNMALRATRGTWFVRVDAHATVPPDYVSRAVAHLRTGEWGGVGGRVEAIGLTPAGKAIAVAMGSRFGIGNSIHHYGKEPVPADHVPFPAYPTDLVREVGGWDESLVINQDFEFDYRMGLRGHRLLYDPRLEIRYICRQSLRAAFGQFRRYGGGKVRVIARHPRSIRARHLAAPALVAWTAGALLLHPRRPKLVLAAMSPYLVAMAVACGADSRKLHDPGAKLRLPAAFAAMHFGWGIGFWRGIGTLVRERFAARGTR
jgi:succinoglycan biosynthesis protein ExoA